MPSGVYKRTSIEERFNKSIAASTESECMLWIGLTLPAGYGRFWAANKRVLAHRFAWEKVNGPIPKEPNGIPWEIDHECRVPGCVNIKHLKLVPPGFNSKQGIKSKTDKTHCKNGHEYNKENIYVYSSYRCCRLCRQKNRRKYKEKR